MSQKEFKQKYGRDLRFTYWVPFGWLDVIVSKEHKNFINYINDGDYGQQNPKVNVYLKSYKLWAKEDISEGEELLLQYPKGYWKK